MVSYLTTPADVANQALDMLGVPDQRLGDISDGTPVAETLRRSYGQLLRGLLRTAHWSFARKQASLDLLGDATGQSAAPVITTVDPPWAYAYAWPIDGVAAIWLPLLPPQIQTNPPLTTGITTILPAPLIPGRFLVSSSNLYPVEVGTIPWDQQHDFSRTEGVGPVTRTIILTDTCNAQLVYTRLATVVEEWDQLFLQAFVSLLALSFVPIVFTDPKERLAQRAAMTGIAKNAIADARVANGNVGTGYPQSTDHQPNWISARSGSWPGLSPGWGGTGYPYFPYDASFSWCGGVF